MTIMTTGDIVWRLTNATRGVTGGAAITSTNFDDNNWAFLQAIIGLQSASAPVGISSITQPVSNEIQINLSNSTSVTFTLPTSAWNFRGAWAPSTIYAVNDVVTDNNSIYLVLYAHTSALTFSATANDGAGHNYYGLLLTIPGVHRTAVNDAAYTIQASDNLVAWTALTASRVATLPAASAYPTATLLTICDESGACAATKTITVTAAGTDKIDGVSTAVLSSAYGALILESDGAGKWTIVASPAAGVYAPLSGATFTGTLNLAAGTATVAPLVMHSGTNLTTPAAGALEYDGTAFYSTVAANERGVIPSEQFVVLASAYTLTSQTAAQKLFNATTNGALTLVAGLYQFDCLFSLSGMSATSGSFGFALGGTATFTQSWEADAVQTTSLTTPNAAQKTFNTTANTALTTASTATNGLARIRGTINVSVAGTLIPQVSLTQAAAAVVAAGSSFKISPLGASAAVDVGNWS